MSKRDYQAIARAIHEMLAPRCSVCALPFTRLSGPSYGCAVHGIRAAAVEAGGVVADRFTRRIADIMAADNPRFDRARFVEACETGKCKGMPR